MAKFKFVEEKWDTENNTGRYTLHVKDARLIFKNFGGRPTKFNSEGGKRGTGLEIDDPAACQKLIDDGWNVKCRKDRETGVMYEPFEELEDGSVVIPFVNLVIRYHHDGDDSRDPKVYLHTSEDDVRGTLLNEAALNELDYVNIKKCIIRIRPSVNFVGYINQLDAWIEPNPVMDDDFWD